MTKLNFIVLITCVLNILNICDCVEPELDTLPSKSVIDLSMPNVRPKKNDDYLCMAKNVEYYGTQYVHAFEPNSDADRAHHMLLFACDDVPEIYTKDGWWDCGHHSRACSSMRIAYAWAKNAPPTILPKDVGFRIGVESNIKYIVLQVHYAHSMPEGSKDTSGFKLHLSPEEPKFLAGVMILYRSNLAIPANTEKIHGDINCKLEKPRPIHPFAYRVHTHKLGTVVSGYVFHKESGDFTKLAKGNPQWPQAFYPMHDNVTINPQELILARCTFSTIGFNRDTRIGQTAADEMCNLYLMFYTDSRDPEDHYIDCGDEEFEGMSNFFPIDSDVPLPRNPLLEEKAKGHGAQPSIHDEVAVPVTSKNDAFDVKKKNHAKKRPGIELPITSHEDVSFQNDFENILDGRTDSDRQFKMSEYTFVPDWPKESVQLGQASGVDLDPAGNVVIFHRGDRTWGYSTFDANNVFAQKSQGPISSNTVIVVHPKTGEVLHEWGKNMFYMPHDITVANNGDTFLTDVALHQVFKFEPGHMEPSLVLGTKFEPGNDDYHFCKPSAVAVLSSGDFFVADGYCNTRIIKFTRDGKKIFQIGRAFQPSLVQKLLNVRPPQRAFNTPHALALGEEKDLLCVADRENGRIQCFRASNGSDLFMIESSLFGGHLFSVAYSAVDGGTLYAVNGPDQHSKVQGFIIPLTTASQGVISGVFSPADRGFGTPHDITVTKNGSYVYVVEISRPYKVWQFKRTSGGRTGKTNTDEVVPPPSIQPSGGPKEPQRRVDISTSPLPTLPNETQPKKGDSPVVDESFSSSVIIMAFLTIPLLLLIGIGACLRLRSNGCCRRTKETKSFAEFFPPSAGFEKLRMDESESDNSDTEVEEFTVSSYRKTNA